MHLQGDLRQMNKQKRELKEQGFKIIQHDVYPVVAEDQEFLALVYLYVYEIDGWWNYEKELIKHKICTKKEFWKKFRS